MAWKQVTIFCYHSEQEYLEERDELIEIRYKHHWFSERKLEQQWPLAVEAMSFEYSYVVCVDRDFNVMREHRRKG